MDSSRHTDQVRLSGRLAGVRVCLLLGALSGGCTADGVTATKRTSSPEVVFSTTVGEPLGDGRPLFTAAVVGVLDEFWAAALPELYGREYRPPTAWFGYTVGSPTGAERAPTCGKSPVDLGSASDNAFYCRPDDSVQWDDALLARLRRETGEFGAALVLAHEWAHVAQARAGVAPGLLHELQADCFAGAWAAEVTAGRFSAVPAGRDQLDQAVVAYLDVRDGLTAADNHGSTFDRVNAFAEGHRLGARRCASYPTEPPMVVPLALPAGGPAGAARPMEDLLAAVPLDLDRYWSGVARLFARDNTNIGVLGLVEATVPCPGLGGPEASAVAVRWCPADGLVRVDAGRLEAAWRDDGDFALATLLGRGWAEAAAAFLTSNEKSPPPLVDCLVGAWARASLASDGGDRGAFQTRLGAGDLDESLLTMLRHPWPPEMATLFDRSEGFGIGVNFGPSACLERTYVR